MQKYFLLAAAGIASAAPAAARDGSGYNGAAGGIHCPKNHHVNGSVDFTDPAVPDLGDQRIATFKFKKGYDDDLNAGYDFGMVRVEGELGYKRATNKSLHFDPAFLTALSTASGGTVTDTTFDLNGHSSVLSGMVNGLLDLGGDSGFGASVGGGFGRARVKSLGDSDSAWAWQLIAAVRTAVSNNIDVGLKYRYFRTGHLDFNDTLAFSGVGTGTGGTLDLDAGKHFSSHSLLASLTYNFGSAAAPAPVAPPPPPPPPVAAPPATQTSPDGSVIFATSACPAPPPPPPPPPVERGERGR
jgi:opacity protein-like surface antigen